MIRSTNAKTRFAVRSKHGLLIGLAGIMACCNVASAQSNWTPLEWQDGNPGKLRHSSYDLGRRFSDDRIPVSDPEARVDVVFLFNQPMTTDQIYMLLCPPVPREQIVYIGKYTSVATVKAIRVRDIQSLVTNDKIAFVEMDAQISPDL